MLNSTELLGRWCDQKDIPERGRQAEVRRRLATVGCTVSPATVSNWFAGRGIDKRHVPALVRVLALDRNDELDLWRSLVSAA
jgi:hypothetical protein